ncbi:MAG: ABC transporter permease subunit [Proteobacteria bacterium]|nr:ABC transporter permease subunit [Pseudomonadota bacterium]
MSLVKRYLNGLGTAIRAEFYVSLRTFGSKLIVLAPSLVVVMQYLIIKLQATSAQARDSLLGGNSFDAMVAENAYGYFVDGLSTGLTMLGLLLVAQAAYSFSYERDVGVVRHLLIRRISRPSLILAKLFHIHVLALLSLLLLMAVSYICSGWLWEFGPIVEDGFELISEAEIREEIGLGLRLAIVPIPPAIAFGLLVSVSAQSTTQAITTALGITLAIDIFKSTMGDFSHYLYATFQPSLLDQSYLQDVSRIVRGFSDVLVDARVQQLNMWVPWPALIIFLCLALVIVQRRKL